MHTCTSTLTKEHLMIFPFCNFWNWERGQCDGTTGLILDCCCCTNRCPRGQEGRSLKQRKGSCSGESCRDEASTKKKEKIKVATLGRMIGNWFDRVSQQQASVLYIFLDPVTPVWGEAKFFLFIFYFFSMCASVCVRACARTGWISRKHKRRRVWVTSLLLGGMHPCPPPLCNSTWHFYYAWNWYNLLHPLATFI